MGLGSTQFEVGSAQAKSLSPQEYPGPSTQSQIQQSPELR